MSTAIDVAHLDEVENPLRWDRFERADRYRRSLELQAQGLSQRQAAKQLQVPRTTLQAWRRWHDTLDICPHVAECFHNGPGLAFLPRLVLAFHLVCVEVGACGMRFVGLLLNLTGLHRFVAASYGAQPKVNRQVEEAIGASTHTETLRLAKAMPRKAISLTQDETCTGGLCLVGRAPVSTCIILAQLAQARDHTTWNDLMAPARAALHCEVRQSTSEEGSGILAYEEHHLGAHHSPDVFHVQHELVKAVSGPLGTKQRAAIKAAMETQQRCEQRRVPPQETGDEPQSHGPVHSPTARARMEQVELEALHARQELARISAQREQVAQSLRNIGQV